jgi:hypothetical protein
MKHIPSPSEYPSPSPAGSSVGYCIYYPGLIQQLNFLNWILSVGIDYAKNWVLFLVPVGTMWRTEYYFWEIYNVGNIV